MLIADIATSKIEVKNYDTISDFCIGLTFIIIGIIFGKMYINKKTYFRLTARSVVMFGNIGFLILAFNRNYLGIILFSCFMGLGLYFGRISSINIGQGITPREKLATTILSGDTITKAIVLFINAIFLSVVNFIGIDKLYYIIGGFLILSLPSMFIIRKPLEKYFAENETKV